MDEKRLYTPPAITDHKRAAAPVWVRAGVHCAVISYPLRRRHGQPFLPTWIALGPLPTDRTPRATEASGTVAIAQDGAVSLVVVDGALAAELEPALLEAARNMVWARDRATSP